MNLECDLIAHPVTYPAFVVVPPQHLKAHLGRICQSFHFTHPDSVRTSMDLSRHIGSGPDLSSNPFEAVYEFHRKIPDASEGHS
jgi:hypothetical protein